MELYELIDLIPGLGIDPTEDELNTLLAAYHADFSAAFKVKGLTIKIISAKSKVRGFEKYPETFVHLITRKGQNGERSFDRHRANKIHWVKCILEHHQEEDISFFKAPDENGDIKDYYWFKDEDFLVIMKEIKPQYAIISGFHIDNQRNRKYFQDKENDYLGTL